MTKKKVTKIKLAKVVQCTLCEGSGIEPNSELWATGSKPCGECLGKKKLPRREAIINLARGKFEDEGRIEFDDNAEVSELDTTENENGAYVQAWVWVDFDGHAGLDLEP